MQFFLNSRSLEKFEIVWNALYAKLRDLCAMFPDVPVLAKTATASRTDIINSLDHILLFFIGF